MLLITFNSKQFAFSAITIYRKKNRKKVWEEQSICAIQCLAHFQTKRKWNKTTRKSKKSACVFFKLELFLYLLDQRNEAFSWCDTQLIYRYLPLCIDIMIVLLFYSTIYLYRILFILSRFYIHNCSSFPTLFFTPPSIFVFHSRREWWICFQSEWLLIYLCWMAKDPAEICQFIFHPVNGFGLFSFCRC